MAFDVNLLVVDVAKVHKDDVGDGCHLVLDVVGFVDDCCSDFLCCGCGCPDDDLLRDVEVEGRRVGLPELLVVQLHVVHLLVIHS